MSQDAERIKTLVLFKQKLEKKIEEAELELKELQATLEAVNSLLLEKGFKRADTVKVRGEIGVPPLKEEKTPTFSQGAYEDVVPLKTATGELLATLYVTGNSLRVVTSNDKNFTANTPPFTTFLVERVLARMQEKDNELVKAGKMKPEEIFSYNIIKDGDVIREINIENVDQDRLRELKSSVRWTLEKMYEKMKQS